MRTLVIGWREASVTALQHLGVEVVCIGPTEVAEAARTLGVSQFVPAADVTDIEDVLFHAMRLRDGGWTFDAVATGSEYPMVCAAVVGAALGVRAFAIETARLLRDKAAQKSAVREAGLPVAGSWLLRADEALPDLDYPVVVKPPAGAGAERTLVIHDPGELSSALTPGEAWLVEEFVSGAELQIDGTVRGGIVRTLTVSRYLSNLIHIHDGELTGAVIVPPVAEPDLYAAAEALVTTALSALKHADGVFHLEAFETRDGLVFSECGGRVSGGGSDRALLLHTGIDIHEEWARAAAGLPPRLPYRPSATAYGDVQLPAPPGTVEQLPTEDDFLKQPGVEHVRMHVTVGDEMPRATKSSVRAATVVVSGPTPEEVRTRMMRLHSWFERNTLVSDGAPAR